VYVEFIIAFMPLFLLFLAICQLSLLVVARLVVSHAAVSAARSAVVVLEDDPKYYRDVPRGTISATGGDQQGLRMTPIRTAAIEPLKILAPGIGALIASGKSIDAAITPMTLAQAVSSELYTNFATAVTLHDTPSSDDLAREPIAAHATVTARVTYFYQCDIPVVRGLICKSVDALIAGKWSFLPVMLTRALGAGGSIPRDLSNRRFFKITAKATLPNQGAQYYLAGDDA
jgi:hypothetical protein